MKQFQLTATVTAIKTTREHRKVMTLRFPMAVGIVDELDFFNPFGFELDDQLIVKVGMDEPGEAWEPEAVMESHGYKLDNN